MLQRDKRRGEREDVHSPTSDSLWVLMISASSKFPAMIATWKERRGGALSGLEQHDFPQGETGPARRDGMERHGASSPKASTPR